MKRNSLNELIVRCLYDLSKFGEINPDDFRELEVVLDEFNRREDKV